MPSLYNLFRKKKEDEIWPTCDLHSHLLPGIDDGVKTVEESLQILKSFFDKGFKKVITTPHIMQDYYPNTPEIIRNKLREVKAALEQTDNTVEIEAAAEYYLDESLLQLLKSDSEILVFGQQFLLFETSFQDKPLFLESAIFEMQSRGFTPIMAHPERYFYLYQDWSLVESLKNKGVLFQLNLNSLGSFYNTESRKMSEKLIDAKMIEFVGSDCHSMRHFEAMISMKKGRYWDKLMSLPLKNDLLL